MSASAPVATADHHEPARIDEADGAAPDPASIYSQVTVEPDSTKLKDQPEQEQKNPLQNGPILTTRPSSGSPRNPSPDKQTSPASSNKLQISAKSPNLRSSRFSDPSLTDHSPLATRMSTVPEHEVPAADEQEKVRKSVQFSRDALEANEPTPQSYTPTDEDTRPDLTKPQSLYSRLRAGLAHGRSASAVSFRSQDARDERNEAAMQATIDEDNTDDDADEESGAESAFTPVPNKKKRKIVRRQDDADTAPPSPHDSRPELYPAQSALSPRSNTSRLFSLPRRITDPDMIAGVSEDEARRNLENTTTPWTPRHPLRGLSHGGQRSGDDTALDGPSRRPFNLLNLTTGTTRDEQAGTPQTDGMKTRRKMFVDRGSTLNSARWRQIKNGLRALTQGKKKERLTPDQVKSAELLAELAAGTPAALILASAFQRDEHGSRRVPALLEQLKVSITDSETVRYKEPGNAIEGDKHLVFRIELEYGNGINRMKWVIRRSLRDFVNMHAKYKLHYQSERLKGRGESSKRYPKFPWSSFPALKGVRGNDEESDDEEPIPDPEGAGTDTERPGLSSRNRTRTSFMLNRRHSSLTGQENTPTTPGGTLLFRRGKDAERERDARFPQRQRQMLELYLQRVIKFMLFRADANRLCKFLEISALGMRLASEGSYHGKEGYLAIRSAKGIDFRRTLTPKYVRARHSPKWFLVRHSYIVCVDSADSMYIYDVFLFDSDLTVQSSKPRREGNERREIGRTARDIAATSKELAKHPQHHRLKLVNSERRLKLLARNERVLHQFEESIRHMIDTSPWCQNNRFDSFAPVRQKCFAQWLVDGRDHMWVLSRALDQAKDVIYIHDWWLSPELYLRRPAAISQKWRLDRILKRKAEQGVKIFVIVYRNIDAAIPIDSQYTKFSLLDLHPNVFVQRSPNQFRQNTFFWAHHEKLCIVDHTLAFVGGIDLCFGRWDTPQHTLTDDKPTGFDTVEFPKDGDHCQLWPGKDYSNPRIQDFYALNKPYEEMYDRSQVARMPWHDISMQIVGQPARDLTRHFVQRWNYILRQRKPTRPTPFLLPPPDFNSADLEALGLDGTCEVQLLRSAGPWSIGTPDKTEHSIMNAYVKMIEESEHFVYMENQFFITSCETEGATVYNRIGDALVERITRAANNEETWRATIVIPLIPGFQNTVEEEGGTSVRLIMQYQYRSICRGESSIFGRLKALGIEPEDYIQFYALRQWGKIGPRQTLATEQLYIHAKVIIVDDRIALIGSANINERSQLGNRDSEVAAVVRDTDMLWSRMNGVPYRVGRFAHTLRMRLMREHLGLDVDKIMEDAQAMEAEHEKVDGKAKAPRPPPKGDNSDDEDPMDARGREIREELLKRNELLSSFNHDVDWEQAGNPNLRANRKLTEDSRVTGKAEHKQDLEGEGYDHMAGIDQAGYGGGRDTIVLPSGKEILLKDQDAEGHNTLADPVQHGAMKRLPTYVQKSEAPNPPMPPRPGVTRMHTEELGLTMVSQLPPLPDTDDSDIGGPNLDTATSTGGEPHHPLVTELKYPFVDRDCMADPIHFSFADDTWHTIAENNTKIYRAVFRCMPDNQVRDWNDYHEYVAYEERFQALQGKVNEPEKVLHPDRDEHKRAGPPGIGTSTLGAQIKALSKVPTDIEKAAESAKDKVKDMVGEDSGKDIESADTADNAVRDALKTWAEHTNRAQMQRTGTDLSMRAFPVLDEKQGLQSVPEDGELANRPDSQGSKSGMDKASTNGTTDGNTEKDRVKEKDGKKDKQGTAGSTTHSGSVRRRRRGTTRSSRRDFSATDDMMTLAEAEELLEKVQGHLIEWPYDWLEKVEAGGNWLYPFDQISPIEIYL
ncbi:Phospholipase D1 [Exophiala xenobiotica]|uniref:Phospholipase n=1 Tax=Lithohypha guttulata TaxID=1690604 RepID=A0ABR0KM99_9EURO|nr:Phospholipase D1 [Lithohypha guttulata]KAK5328260.1 Phospholipase D1 [Exophiala xenobiotica]